MSQDSCDDEDKQPTPPLTLVEPPGSQRTTPIGQEDDQIPKLPIWKRLTFWNVAFNCILAITTVLLGLIAYWQLDSSHLDQRAWVGPTSFIRGPDVIKEGSRPSFGVVIANTGKTPARKMGVMVGAQPLPKGAPFSARYDAGGPTSTGILFPGATAAVTTNQMPHPLTAKEVEIITTGEFILYVYGVITYEDIFGVTHQTTYCGYLTTDFTSYKICSTYNEAN